MNLRRMHCRTWRITAIALVAALAPVSGPARAADPAPPTTIAIPVGRHVGDLGGMVERRTIRVLTVYNKTTFVFDNGAPRGVAFEALTKFGEELNRNLHLPGGTGRDAVRSRQPGPC